MKRVRNAAEFTKARERIGFTKTEVAEIMGLNDPKNAGQQTVARWEGTRSDSNSNGPPAPVRVLMEALLSGWRPITWKGK